MRNGFAHLSQFSHLLLQTTDAGKGRSSWVLQGHLVHRWVDFSWEDAHDGQGGHVEADACVGFKFRGGESGSIGYNIARS